MKSMFKKKNIFILILFISIIFVTSSNVYADLTDDSLPGVGDPLYQKITEVIKTIGGWKAGSMLIPMTTLVTALALVIFLVLWMLFVGTGGTGALTFPFPDQVIFNRLPLFDPNFINPYSSAGSSALTSTMQSTISNLYGTGYTVAVAVFTIAALIMGIKLVVSTIASEKAQYKEAVSKWLFGIVLLFTMHWIISGVFTLNEEIVRIVAQSSGTAVEFEISILQSIPLVGNMLSGIVDGFGSLFGTSNLSSTLSFTMAGYGGFILKYMLKAIGGDLISSIILFIILGQTIAIIIAYLKRLFYCIILGVIAPLIVAFDTVKKVLGQKSEILNNWFQNFVITVFMQSFHAIFLMFILQMLSALNGSDGVQSLMALVGAMALIKFEKTFKELFGLKDGLGGSIKGAGAKAIIAAKGVTSAAKNLTDNASKEKKAKSRQVDLTKRRAALMRDLSTPSSSPLGGSGGNRTITPGSMTPSGILIGSDSAPISSQVSANQNPMLAGTTGTPTGAGGVGSTNAIAANTQAINNLVAALNKKEQNEQVKDRKAKEEELRKVEEELQDANKDVAGAKFARLMAPAVAIGAAGIGFGMMDETSESLAMAGVLASGGDLLAEKVGRRGAMQANQKLYEESIEQGRENPNLKVKGAKVSINSAGEIENVNDLDVDANINVNSDGLDDTVNKMEKLDKMNGRKNISVGSDTRDLDETINKMDKLDKMKDIVKTATLSMTVDPIKKSASQFKEIGSVIRGKSHVSVDNVGDIE